MITGMQVSGCSALSPRPATQHRVPPSPSGRAVLLADFSRAGENYHYGGRTRLTVGNTEVLARMISRHIECDVHRILPADPYPDGYSPTVERNVREQNADARPAVDGPSPSMDRYDTVLLGSPIWNVRAPMIMSTFTEGLDFRGKTVIPFTTHAMSGLGTTARGYAASCPGAIFAEGLAVRGEQVNDADADVQAWLGRLGLLPLSPGPTRPPASNPGNSPELLRLRGKDIPGAVVRTSTKLLDQSERRGRMSFQRVGELHDVDREYRDRFQSLDSRFSRDRTSALQCLAFAENLARVSDDGTLSTEALQRAISWSAHRSERGGTVENRPTAGTALSRSSKHTKITLPGHTLGHHRIRARAV